MTDSLRLTCTACGQGNRVPLVRLAQGPKCGVCGEALVSGKVAELDPPTHDKAVRSDDLPLLVDYWAPWCGPCRMMAPAFAQAGAQLQGQALLVKVNSDDNPGLSQRFGIRSIPTLVRLQAGRETSRQSGALPAGAIVALAQRG